jgi:hypothetical protein
MKQGRLFIAPVDSSTWNLIFVSFDKTDEDIVRHETTKGPLRLLEVSQTELEAAMRSRRDKGLDFQAFVEGGEGEPLIPFDLRRGWRQGRRPRDPQVDLMREALLRQLKRSGAHVCH